MQRNKRIRGRQRGRSGKVLLPALFAILLGAVGAFVTLVAFGQIDVEAPGLARFFGGGEEEEVAATDRAPQRESVDMYTPPPGYDKTDWVPLVVKPIPAHSLIQREYMTFQHNLRPWPKWAKESERGESWIANLGEAMGRVAAFDIPAGTVLTEEMLKPRGTRAGIMGAVPEGNRALVFDADAVIGAHSLRQGDHIDLFATFEPVEELAGLSRYGRGIRPIVTGQMVERAGLERPELRVIVENGIVVQPVRTRMTVDRGRDGVVEEMSLSASPDEIAGLTEALKLGATLYAIVRPGADPDETLILEASTSGPGSRIYGIEEIVGEKRSMTVIPGGGQ